MPGSVVVSGLYQGQEHTFVRGEDFGANAAAGTVQRLPAGKLVPGQKVTIAFVPLPVTRSSLEGHQKNYPGVVRSVPSTARPAAPNVLYTLPAWSFSGPSARRTCSRAGGSGAGCGFTCAGPGGLPAEANSSGCYWPTPMGPRSARTTPSGGPTHYGRPTP